VVTEVQTLDDGESRDASSERPVPGVALLFTEHAAVLRTRRLGRDRLVLGRADVEGHDSQDARLSREHAEVTYDRGTWRVRDLDSRNGTFVAGSQVAGEVTLRGRAIVRAGHTLYLLLPDVRALERDGAIAIDGDAVIGPAISEVRARVAAAARAGDPVLITGESGTGKELVARHYHELGRVRTAPFIAVNCAAIPEAIAERLLFGTRKGAYSGADEDAEGYAAAARGGTLFLDEIGDLAAPIQAKLLRLLETSEVTPLGATKGWKVDFRVCAATHRPLKDAVARREFRDDLYYRIGRPEVAVPPLRERVEEIPWLVTRALARNNLDASARLVEACCLRPWPGNIRELLREMRRAAAEAVAKGERRVGSAQLDADAGMPLSAGSEPRADELTRADVERALEAAGDNVSAAARALGLHRTQLYRVLRKMGLRRDDE
jgi:DNA-binding NtrC family response regulator